MHILTTGKFSLRLDPPSEIYHEHSANLEACTSPHPYFFNMHLPFTFCLSGSVFSCLNDVSSYLPLYTCGDFPLTLKTEDLCAQAVPHTVVTVRVCMASYRKN